MMALSLSLNIFNVDINADATTRSSASPVASSQYIQSSPSSSSVANVVDHHHHQQQQHINSISTDKSIVFSDNSPSSLLSTPSASILAPVDNYYANINFKENSNNSSNSSQPDWFDLPKMDNFVDLFSLGCSTAVIFGGLIPYIPQYLKIKRSMNADGFSTYVCLTLLLANILRIMFWFGHHFEIPLLIQSFVMIAGMLAMMHICVRVRDKIPPFSVSSMIGSGRGSSGSGRRFRLNGKLHDDNNRNKPSTSCDNDDKNNENLPNNDSTAGDEDANCDGELTPIFSVPSSSLMGMNSASSSLSSSYVPKTKEFQHSSTSRQDNISINSSYQNEVLQDSVRYSSPSILSSSSSSQRNQIVGDNDDNIESISIQTYQASRSNGNIKCSYLHNFWNWDDLFSYIKFVSMFTLVLGVLTYLLLDNNLFVESLGFVAVFTESMLGMPQLFRNYVKKSTRGMSVEMVAMWLSGDLFKTLYFIVRKTPVQFYVCGSIQVVVDILILGQVLWYRRPNVTYRKLPKSG